MTLAEEEEGASPRSVPVTNNLAQKLRMCIARGGDATTDDERKPLRWFEWFPVINLFVDMLGFDEIPSWDGVEKAWNLLALVDALLLTVVFQVPMAFENDELLEINERYGNEQNGYGDWFGTFDNPMSVSGRDDYLTYRGLFSNRIVYFFAVASASLSISFISILHYASSSTSAAAPPTVSPPLASRGAAASYDAFNSAEEDDDRQHKPNASPHRSLLLASRSFKRSSTGLSDVVKEHDSCFGVGIRLPWERKK
ncbi:hypothetical protein NFJ02_04g115060 [Pycnococcus provasolii]